MPQNILSTSRSSFYEELGIEAPLRGHLETTASYIFEAGRKTTEQTFELGDHLEAAAALLLEGTFNKWVAKRCGLSVRSARNYRSVFRNLSPHRDTLVDLSVGATVLFHLSTATPEQVDEAIAFAQDQGHLKVSDVKSILSGADKTDDDKAAQADPSSIGGVDGLKALIAAKVREGLKAFIAHVAAICQAIDAALARPRVIKEALAKEIQDVARVARQELESLALFIEPELDWGRNTRPTKFPKGSGWAAVNDTLYRLGGIDSWPRSKEMPGWLSEEVLPILGWAVTKERKPEWPLAATGMADLGPAAETDPVIMADRADAALAVREASDAAVTDDDVERLNEALTKATGGFITISRDTPSERKQVSAVPPLAAEPVAEPGSAKGFKRPAFLDRGKPAAEDSDAEPAPTAMR